MVRVVQASRTARRGPARATPRAGAHPSPRPPPAPRSWRSRKLQVAPPRRRGCRRAREPTQRSPGESLVCLFLDSRTTAAARSSSASSRSRLLASPSLSGATPSLSGATPSRAAIGGSGSISRQSNGAYDEWGPRPRTAMRRWPTSTGLRAQATTSAFPARRRRPTPSRCCFRYASWMATYGHVI